MRTESLACGRYICNYRRARRRSAVLRRGVHSFAKRCQRKVRSAPARIWRPRWSGCGHWSRARLQPRARARFHPLRGEATTEHNAASVVRPPSTRQQVMISPPTDIASLVSASRYVRTRASSWRHTCVQLRRFVARRRFDRNMWQRSPHLLMRTMAMTLSVSRVGPCTVFPPAAQFLMCGVCLTVVTTPFRQYR